MDLLPERLEQQGDRIEKQVESAVHLLESIVGKTMGGIRRQFLSEVLWQVFESSFKKQNVNVAVIFFVLKQSGFWDAYAEYVERQIGLAGDEIVAGVDDGRREYLAGEGFFGRIGMASRQNTERIMQRIEVKKRLKELSAGNDELYWQNVQRVNTLDEDRFGSLYGWMQLNSHKSGLKLVFSAEQNADDTPYKPDHRSAA